MSAMATVLHRAPEVLRACDAVLGRFFLHEEFDGDPKQQQPASEPQHGYLEDVLQPHREDDAQENGSAGAENDSPYALAARQATAGERDDNRVVSGEEDVDPYDLEDLDTDRAVIAERQAELCDQLVDQVPEPPVTSWPIPFGRAACL